MGGHGVPSSSSTKVGYHEYESHQIFLCCSIPLPMSHVNNITPNKNLRRLQRHPLVRWRTQNINLLNSPLSLTDCRILFLITPESNISFADDKKWFSSFLLFVTFVGIKTIHVLQQVNLVQWKHTIYYQNDSPDTWLVNNSFRRDGGLLILINISNTRVAL